MTAWSLALATRYRFGFSASCIEVCEISRGQSPKDNRSTSNQSTIDYASSVNAYTNINCIFRDNIQEQSGIISHGKIVVNCTYFGNVTHNGANYGDICRNCRMWNTVLDKNYQEKGKDPYYHCDVRAHNENGDLTLVMTNCVFGGIVRYMFLAWRKGDVGRPEMVLLTDRPLWIMIASYGVSAVVVVLAGLS